MSQRRRLFRPPDLLIAHAERVIVCNVRGRSETTNKSDRIDADGLSELLRLGALKPVFHACPHDRRVPVGRG